MKKALVSLLGALCLALGGMVFSACTIAPDSGSAVPGTSTSGDSGSSGTSAGSASSSASGSDEACVHNYVGVTTEATCTKDGKTVYTCEYCQDTYTETLPATGHTAETVKGKAATCTESGLTDGKKCAVCGEVIVAQTVLPASGHTEGDWITDKAANCLESGSKHTECTVCHEKIHTEAIPAGGHTEGDWITDKAATCLETGSKHTECAVCHETVHTETIPLAAHTAETVKGKAATCTESGLTDGTKCSVCGEVIVAQTVIPATDHQYEREVTAQADCETAGTEIFTCKTCGDTYTQTIPATGHDYALVDSKAAVCGVAGYEKYECKNCKDAYTDELPALSHKYVVTSKKDVTCTTDGYTEYTCENCKDSYTTDVVKATGHSTESATWTETGRTPDGCIVTVYEEATCPVCKESVTRSHVEEKHTYVGTIAKAATCSEAGEMTYRCSVCGDTSKEPTEIAKNDNHAWDEGVLDATTGITKYTCTACGETKTTFSATDKTETTIDQTAVAAGEIALKEATIEMDKATQDSIKGVENLSISANQLTEEEKNGLSATAQEKIGNAPVYDFNLTQTVSSDQGASPEKVTFEGTMTITVPYTLAEGQDPATVAVYFIEGDNVTPYKATYYESNGQGYATFETTHFSYYTVVRLSAADTCALYKHKPFTKTEKATCTTDGYIVTVCTRCGEVIKEKEIIPATGHDYRTTVTEATCTTGGYTTYTCSVCGDEYKDNYVDAIGHAYKESVTAPTCTKMGYTVYTCSVCGDEYKGNYVAATGHEYTESAELSVAPTCTTSGVKAEICEVCGAEKKTLIPATKHRYESVVTEATCTTGGYTTYTCSVCGDEYVSDYVSATGHKYEQKVTEATCTTSGYTTYTCSVCGDSYTGDYTTALGHDYVSSITAPDCTHGGYTDFTCSRCEESYRGDYTPATGHDYQTTVTEATCTTGGYTTYTCSVCGESYVSDYVSPAGHKYVAEVTAPTCTAGGYTTYTCSVCGDSYTDDLTAATGHHYENGVCTACGDGCVHVLGAYVSNGDATCRKDGTKSATCEKCGYVSTVTDEGTKLEHTYTSETTAATCTTDGKTVYTCSACGDSYTEVIGKLGHDYVGETTAATCTTDGKTVYTCSRCDKSYTEVIDKLGHDYVGETTDATCMENGRTVYTCSRCGDSYTETIPAKGHHFADGVCTVCGEKESQGSDLGYYTTLVESLLKCEKVSIRLENLDVNYISDGETFVTYRCELAQVVLGVDENGALYGKAEGTLYMVNKLDGASENTVEIKAIIRDNTVYFTETMAQGDMTESITGEAYLPELIMGAMGSMGTGIPVDQLEAAAAQYEDVIRQAIALLKSVYAQNANGVENMLSGLAEELFTREASENGYVVSLDFAKLIAFNELLHEQSIFGLIDHFAGAGTSEKLYNYILAAADKKVAELADDIINFADGYGLKVADVYAVIENAIYIATGERVSVDEMVRQYYDLTVKDLVANMVPTGQPDVKYESKPIYDENGNIIGYETPTEAETPVESEPFDYTVYVQQYYEMFSGLSVYEVISGLVMGDPAGGESVYTVVKQILATIDGEASIVVSTDKKGNVQSVVVKAENVDIGSDSVGGDGTTVDKVTADGVLIVTPNGDITVDFEGLPEEIRALVAAIDFSANETIGNWTVVTAADGSVKLVMEMGEKQEQPIEEPQEYNGVEYIAKLVWYNGYRTVSIDVDRCIGCVIIPDCGDWNQYSYSFRATEEVRYGIFIEYYTESGELVASVPYDVPEMTEAGLESGRTEITAGQWGVYIYYNAKTGELSDQSSHNFVKDESQSIVPTICGEEGKDVYVCSVCGEVNVHYYSIGHNVKEEYVLAEGSKSCEDGVIVRSVCTICGEVLKQNTIYGHITNHKETELKTGCGTIIIIEDGCPCGEQTNMSVYSKDCSFMAEHDTTAEGAEVIVYTCKSCGYVYIEERSSAQNGCEIMYTTTYRFNVTETGYEKEVSYTRRETGHVISSQIETETDDNGRVIRKIETQTCNNCGKTVHIYTYTYSYEMTEKGQVVIYRQEEPETGYWREEVRTYTSICEYEGQVTTSRGENYKTGGSTHNYEQQYALAEGSITCEDGVVVKMVCTVCGKAEKSYTVYGHRYENEYIVEGEGYAVYRKACAVCGYGSDNGFEYYGFSSEYKYDENNNGYHVYTSNDGTYVFVCAETREKDENCVVRYYRTYYFNVKLATKEYESKTEPVVYNSNEEHTYTGVPNSYTDKDGNRVEVCTNTCSVCGRVEVTTDTYAGENQIAHEYVIDGAVIESWRREYTYDTEGNATGYDYYIGNAETPNSSYILHEGGEYITYNKKESDSELIEEYTAYDFENCSATCRIVHTYKDGREPWEENAYTLEVHTIVETRTLLGASCGDGIRIDRTCKYCEYSEESRIEYGHKYSDLHTDTVKSACGENVITERGCLCGQLHDYNFQWACEMGDLDIVWLDNGHRVEAYRCAVTACAYTYTVEYYTEYDKVNCTRAEYRIYRLGVTIDEKDINSYVNDDCDLVIRYEGRAYAWHDTVESVEGEYHIRTCVNCNQTIEKWYSHYEYGRLIEEYHEECLTGYWWRRTYTYTTFCCGTEMYTDSKSGEYTSEFERHEWVYADSQLNCTEYGYVGEYCYHCGETRVFDYVEPEHDYVFDEELQMEVCSRCGLQNKTGVDGNFIMEDKSAGSNYVVSFFNKECTVGNSGYEIIIELVAGENTYVIGGSDYDTVTLNEAEYAGVNYNMNRLLKSGKITVIAKEVDVFAGILGLTEYNLRVSFLYNDFADGTYLNESITLDNLGQKACAHQYECSASEKAWDCVVTKTYTCVLCKDTYTEEVVEHNFAETVNEDGSVSVLCQDCGAKQEEVVKPEEGEIAA